MNNSEQFQTILSALNANDMDTVREFIRDVVRAEWGGLINDLSEKTYGATMPEDPWLDKTPEPTEMDAPEADFEPQGMRPMVQVDIHGITIRFGLS